MTIYRNVKKYTETGTSLKRKEISLGPGFDVWDISAVQTFSKPSPCIPLFKVGSIVTQLLLVLV